MPLDSALLSWLGGLVRAHAALAALALLGSTLALPALFAATAWELRGGVGGRQRALLLGAGLALAAAVILQQLGGRSRPLETLAFWPAPPTPSCPSGHAALAAAIAVTWALGRPRRWLPAFGIAAWIGLSRVALGHHHASDVVLGGVLGLGVGVAAWELVAGGLGPVRRWGGLLWAQVALVVVISGMAWLGVGPRALLAHPGSDKVLHTLLFGLLALFGALRTGGRARAVLVPLALAAAEEAAQSLSPIRTADWGDLACDLGGMLAFFGVARAALWRWGRGEDPSPPFSDAGGPMSPFFGRWPTRAAGRPGRGAGPSLE